MNTLLNNKKICVLIVLLILLGCVLYSVGNSDNDSKEQRYELFKKQIDKDYATNVEIIKQSKYLSEEELKELTLFFAKFENPRDFSRLDVDAFGYDKVVAVYNNYPDGRWLSKYVTALKYETGTPEIKQVFRTNAAQYKAAYQFISEIPDNYNGVLAEKIKQDKKRLREKAEKAGALLEAAQAEENALLHIGDPETKIEQVYGPPRKVNIDQNANNEHKQYVYDDKFIYTDNGRVTNFQTR